MPYVCVCTRACVSFSFRYTEPKPQWRIVSCRFPERIWRSSKKPSIKLVSSSHSEISHTRDPDMTNTCTLTHSWHRCVDSRLLIKVQVLQRRHKIWRLRKRLLWLWRRGRALVWAVQHARFGCQVLSVHKITLCVCVWLQKCFFSSRLNEIISKHPLRYLEQEDLQEC